jgi:gp6-like head-tail connector protein
MADRIIKILTPAASYNLLTLDELKVMLGIDPTDTSQDAQLTQYIKSYSALIARSCNRVFARETVRETWRCNEQARIFLSHWPVAETDITSIESPRGTPIAIGDYEVEERSGKIEFFTSYADPVVVEYTGGYLLPDETPEDLKEALTLFVRNAQAMAHRMTTAGIRSISHKEARVMFFDPNVATKGQQGLLGSVQINAATNTLLMHYTRLEC